MLFACAAEKQKSPLSDFTFDKGDFLFLLCDGLLAFVSDRRKERVGRKKCIYAAKRRSLADTEAARNILTASGMRKGRTVTGNVAM